MKNEPEITKGTQNNLLHSLPGFAIAQIFNNVLFYTYYFLLTINIDY